MGITSAMGPASVEVCAKVNFPQGLLPPGQVIMSQLEQVKPKVETMLNQMPHQDVTVDGSNVALYEKPGESICLKYANCDHSNDYCANGAPPCLEHRKIGPDVFLGIMSDATPVGAGIQGPANGKWDSAIVKFSDWAKGAGAIEDESCVTMSATELLHSHHANRTLWAFDQLMSQLRSTQSLSSALAFIPAKPSDIFASAAKLERIKDGAVKFDEGAKVKISVPSAWLTGAMAALAGVVGAVLVLVISKRSQPPARDYA